MSRAALLSVILLLGLGMPVLVLLQGYEGRVALVRAQRAGCQRDIADRWTTIRVRTVQARGAQAIAGDPFQSRRTRVARATEAVVLRGSVRDLTRRVDAEHGGLLDCDRAFPPARLLP